MIGFLEAPKAWGFTRGMARVLGYSLTDAVIEGWLSRKELGTLVEACQTCSQTNDCTKWLATTTKSAAGPEFCPNSAALESLMP